METRIRRISVAVLCGLIFIDSIAGVNVLRRRFSSNVHCSVEGQPVGDPLFLTPYIEAGRAEDGRIAAVVPPILDEIQSFSGYLTVDAKLRSNLFFWYFPAESKRVSAPVAVWLQGGPGGSSMFGLFSETGPLVVRSNLTVTGRKYSWTKDIHMIYIDNPVGTGFSFTEDPSGYATNEEQVGRALHSALVQFFQLFPELRNNGFFITGESYAGKYIPALAYAIHVNNPSASVKINLQGVAIGDGLVDPENMMKYGDYLIQIGLLDEEGRKQIQTIENNIVESIRTEKYDEAAVLFDRIFQCVSERTGNVDVYNFLKNGEKEISGETLSQFLCQPQIRKRIHVGNLTFNDGATVALHLQRDMMKTVKPWLEVLLNNNYRVLLYNGQLDIVVAYPLTVNFVQKLLWSGADEYRAAKRKKWFVDDTLAGYSKSAGNFTELVVRNAGHMVPSDQPQWSLEMIRKFVFNEPF